MWKEFVKLDLEKFIVFLVLIPIGTFYFTERVRAPCLPMLCPDPFLDILGLILDFPLYFFVAKYQTEVPLFVMILTLIYWYYFSCLIVSLGKSFKKWRK